jgi:hypothetical protein
MQLALGLDLDPAPERPARDVERGRTDERAEERSDVEPIDEAAAEERGPDPYLVDAAWSELDDVVTAWPPDMDEGVSPDAIWGGLLDQWPAEADVGLDERGDAIDPQPETESVDGGVDVWPWDEPVGEQVDRPEDVRELRLLGDAELEEVGRELVEVLDPEAWARADLPERMRMAQHAHAHIQDAYGLDSAPLLYDMNLPGPVAGRFDPGTGMVSVNPALLEDDHPGELLDTLAHESRHQVQVALVEELREADGDRAPREGVDWAAVERFGDAMTRYDANDAAAYHASEVEVDARRAGLQLAGNGYWRAYMESLEG